MSSWLGGLAVAVVPPIWILSITALSLVVRKIAVTAASLYCRICAVRVALYTHDEEQAARALKVIKVLAARRPR